MGGERRRGEENERVEEEGLRENWRIRRRVKYDILEVG
jgi:hypothetical protein